MGGAIEMTNRTRGFVMGPEAQIGLLLASRPTEPSPGFLMRDPIDRVSSSQRMELRKQRLLEHAERKERHAQQQKEYREKRRLQKEYEEAYRQDLTRQDAAVRLLQLYARRAASIHDIATGSGPMQLKGTQAVRNV